MLEVIAEKSLGIDRQELVKQVTQRLEKSAAESNVKPPNVTGGIEKWLLDVRAQQIQCTTNGDQ